MIDVEAGKRDATARSERWCRELLANKAVLAAQTAVATTAISSVLSPYCETVIHKVCSEAGPCQSWTRSFRSGAKLGGARADGTCKKLLEDEAAMRVQIEAAKLTGDK
jgi:hypothetical protein